MEWNTKETEYVNELKQQAVKLLSLVVAEEEMEKILEDIYWSTVRKGTVKDEEYEMLYLSQYPGYSGSYYLGAFWLEYQLENEKYKTPKDFLDELEERPWGDLFKLW